MGKGTIIYLNGVTSSGKTSIVSELRKLYRDFFYLSDDVFEDHIIDIEYDSSSYWKDLAEAVFLMYKTAKLFSDHGKTVIIDSMLLEKPEFSPHYETMLNIFSNSPLVMIHVHCPLEICRQRNMSRTDRFEMQSHEQADLMAKNVSYDLELDSSIFSPQECAERLLGFINAWR